MGGCLAWKWGHDILVSERIWCQVQCWPQRFSSVSVSQPGAGGSSLSGLWKSKSWQGKTLKSNPAYLIQEMRGEKEEDKRWWVQTQALQALILRIKSSGGACPWCKTLWNRRDPSHCPLRGGQVYEIQAHVSRQKDLIGI